ncbi:MAG: Gfo/Idh/MocA family oxidoreductase [Paludibacter sp.]|jgi:predicted dehydrogenase|nr:Gfo/Idh/MocA family oxidoreductase [Paludibacter sp.]
MKNIRWGIIGCGNVTELKSGPAFQKVPGSELVSVMRRNTALAADYAQRHGVARWYADASALINDPEVNAVYIATPPDTHALYAIQAMKAGKPVYVEKPMARTFAECEEMIRVSEQTGQPLYVAYYRRTLPGFLKVKEMIEGAEIGRVLTVNMRLHKAFGERDRFPEKQSWHVKPLISGAGHFYDLASHQFDYLDFLFGPVTAVKGEARNVAGFYEAEDTVSAVYAFENRVTGTGSWSFVVDKGAEEDVIEITGTEGKIELSCFDKKPMTLIKGTEVISMEFQNPENISFNLVEQVTHALQGTAECVSTMYSAARTSWVLEEIVKDYYTGSSTQL